MLKFIKIIVLTIILHSPQVAFGSWLFGPSNFQECMQKYQKNAGSEFAASVIYFACVEKFNKRINEKFSECLLEHTGNTKSELAIKIIFAACSDLYKYGVKKHYSKCILKNMPGVDVDISAKLLTSSCN